MYKHRKPNLLTFTLVAATLVAGVPVLAQEDEPTIDESTERCISIHRIRRTDVVDDQNVLFYMRGSDVYLNTLARRCPGLAREGRFSYKTSLSRLCQLDSIAVLYSEGSGLREGPRCGLGMFHKITQEDAEAIKEGANAEPEAEPLPLPEPEEVGGEEKDPELP